MFRTDNFEVLAPKVYRPGEQQVYAPDQIRIKEVFASGYHPQDWDIEERVETAWGDLLKSAKEQQEAGLREGLPFSGPLYKLVDHVVGFKGQPAKPQLHLTVGATNFRDSYGTNWMAGQDPEYKALLKKRGVERVDDERHYFANALALCTALKTHNELGKEVYVVGFRSFEQDEYSLSLHVPGTLGSRKPFQDRPFDPFESVYLECLRKELGLEESEVDDLVCTGLVRNGYTEKPELTFRAEVSVPFEKIERDRHQQAPQRAEHFQIIGVTKEEAMWLLANTQNPDDLSFIEHLGLETTEHTKLTGEYEKRSEYVVNTGNMWVPPGEAALILALANDGVEVTRLPYIEETHSV